MTRTIDDTEADETAAREAWQRWCWARELGLDPRVVDLLALPDGTPRASPAGMAPPIVPPWHRSASVAAGLPTDRAAWLARVLPLVASVPVDREIAAALGVTRPVARTTWATWRAWLSSEHAAGRLPEWGADPWPEPLVGARPGAPLRGAVRARHEAAEARRSATARDHSLVSG